MTFWNHAGFAPRDGTHIRVKVRGNRELPWLLYFEDGLWRYATTDNPVFEWHLPLEWTAEPRTEAENAHFAEVIAGLGGPRVRAPERRILHLVGPEPKKNDWWLT